MAPTVACDLLIDDIYCKNYCPNYEDFVVALRTVVYLRNRCASPLGSKMQVRREGAEWREYSLTVEAKEGPQDDPYNKAGGADFVTLSRRQLRMST